ncbi:hypothetical protein V2W45_1326593 [Cenococcum geophilum]
MALDRIARFVVNPRKSLKRLLPLLIASIRREINIYGAGITVDMEILLGDCILVWTMYLLGYSLTKVRDSVLAWKKELFAIINRLLYNLTAIYIINHLIYKKDELKNELTIQAWGKTADLKHCNIAIDSLANLTRFTPLIKQDVILGISTLFDPRADHSNLIMGCDALYQRGGIDIDGDKDGTNLAKIKDKELTFQHMSGYPLDRGGENY